MVRSATSYLAVALLIFTYSLLLKGSILQKQSPTISASDLGDRKLLSFFGRSSKRGLALYEKVRESTSLINQTFLLPIDLPLGLVEVSGNAIAVGYISSGSVVGGGLSLLANIQAFIEGTIKQDNCAEVVLLLDDLVGDHESSVEALTELFDEALTLASSTLSDVRPSPSVKDKLKFEIISIRGLTNDDVVRAIEAKVNGSDCVRSGKDLVSLTNILAARATFSKAQGANSMHVKEVRATEPCKRVAEDFIRGFSERIVEALPAIASILSSDESAGRGGIVSSITTGALLSAYSASAVSEIVQQESAQNFAIHSAVFDEFGDTDAMLRAAYEVRVAMASTLQKIFRLSVTQLLSSCLDSFDAGSRKVLPDYRLPSGLKNLAAAFQEAVSMRIDDMKSGFTSVLSVDKVVSSVTKAEVNQDDPAAIAVAPAEAEGLFGAAINARLLNLQPLPLLPVGANVAYNLRPLINSFGSFGAAQLLRQKLAEKCATRQQELFLSGYYNPYIRTLPFPPLELKFNYLLDPRALSFSLMYDKLYDEHIEGPAPHRASPLLIPGVALAPFDPNHHAVPPPTKPWWRVLIDFYRNEL